jgi:hypothetical protein
MAYLFTERYNIRNGIATLSAAVSDVNRLGECICKLGADVAYNQLTVDTVIASAPSGTYIMRDRNVNPGQLTEWGERARRMRVQVDTYSLVFDDSAYSVGVSDTVLVNIAKRCIYPIAQLM